MFVFGCMVEYAIVHYSKRVAEERKLRKKNDEEVTNGANGHALIRTAHLPCQPITLLWTIQHQSVILSHENHLPSYPTLGRFL